MGNAHLSKCCEVVDLDAFDDFDASGSPRAARHALKRLSRARQEKQPLCKERPPLDEVHSCGNIEWRNESMQDLPALLHMLLCQPSESEKADRLPERGISEFDLRQDSIDRFEQPSKEISERLPLTEEFPIELSPEPDKVTRTFSTAITRTLSTESQASSVLDDAEDHLAILLQVPTEPFSSRSEPGSSRGVMARRKSADIPSQVLCDEDPSQLLRDKGRTDMLLAHCFSDLDMPDFEAIHFAAGKSLANDPE
eukprot:TRINITY_DN35165_c0_g1_i1.p1 TRINITY_DN35165_c0_g1~~TRINITY_DN35165_c0_g1_i1.p1  ORF type:complete len:253 (+),score=54.32 TRINITY_DN35165_c0_g1_i1:46-804(+)